MDSIELKLAVDKTVNTFRLDLDLLTGAEFGWFIANAGGYLPGGLLAFLAQAIVVATEDCGVDSVAPLDDALYRAAKQLVEGRKE